jgi:hypothetical protein
MRYERDMTAPVLAWMQRQGLHVQTECSTPWGICDLVGVSFRTRNVKRRLALRQSSTIGSQFDISVLACLPDAEFDEGISVAAIRDLLGGFSTVSSIETTLAKLEQRRFVRRTGGQFAKINGWMPLHQRIVAVELKLGRVEEVIQQASNHVGFATESYVGLPMDVAQRLAKSPRLGGVIKAGVGIIGITEHKVRTLRRADTSAHMSIPWLQMHMTERFWRAGYKQLSMSGSAIDSGLRVAPSSSSSDSRSLP